MIKKVFRKILLLAYIILITYLSIMPSKYFKAVPHFPYSDKIAHILIYTGFTFLLFWAFEPAFNKWKAIIPFFLVLSWGIMIEILQRILPYNRMLDFYDIIANIAGFFVGYLFWIIFKKIRSFY